MKNLLLKTKEMLTQKCENRKNRLKNTWHVLLEMENLKKLNIMELLKRELIYIEHTKTGVKLF